MGAIQPSRLHERSPYVPNFEDLTQEETWELANSFHKLNKNTTFFSPSLDWCLPTPSTIKPKATEFVVDSGASMHMLSKKDLNSGELETVQESRNP